MTAPFQILVVDADPATAQRVRDHFQARPLPAPAAEVVTCTVEAAAERLATTGCAVLLVDPQTENDRGLTLLAANTAAQVPTVVVTARTDLAVRAFESGAIDFVPKPFVASRLAVALERVAPTPARAPTGRPLLALRRHGRIDLVDLDDLVYAEGADKYSELVFANGRRDLHDKNLSRLEAALPATFVRIHKSYLVRFNLVSRLRVLRGSRYFAELTNGLRLPVGRSRYRQLKTRLI